MKARRAVLWWGLVIGIWICDSGLRTKAEAPLPAHAQRPALELRNLTGDDAKRAEELTKASETALKRDRWDEAIATEELLAVHMRVQGPLHFETLDSEWRLNTLRRLLGTDASEPELARLVASCELGKFGFIHMATHAVIDERVPTRSAVILTQMGLPNPLEQALSNKPVFDGRLSVREIQRGWELKAELVTLSACETPLGRDGDGEGFIGFTQALLMSGARSVCLSLWKVDDTAISLLMQRFYQNLLAKRDGLGGPLPKGDALKEAKAWLRELRAEEMASLTRSEPRKTLKGRTLPAVTRFDHPYYWAGFVLIGDPD
jgi:hypothetical protein